MTSEAVNHTTSHIGFKGVEDLGGGLKTGFRLEQAINLKNGETAFLQNTQLQRHAHMKHRRRCELQPFSRTLWGCRAFRLRQQPIQLQNARAWRLQRRSGFHGQGRQQ